MPRKRVAKPPKPRQPGYSFADVLVLTEATKSNLIHWTTRGVVGGDTSVITADIADTPGRGYPRRFSTLNIIEAQLAFAINKFGVPAETLWLAVQTFRQFHSRAVAIYEESKELPFEQSAGNPKLFRDATERTSTANSYYDRDRWDVEHGRMTFEQARARAIAVGDVWNFIRSGPFIEGKGDASAHDHFLGLFIAKEADSNYRDIPDVWLDPSAAELNDAIGQSAIVISLADVVFRVGEHCKRLGGVRLDRW